jgi:ubiquinone/menaquinone biosynthesis C-methylase UbiE
MQINQDNIVQVCDERDIYNTLLSFDNKHIIELGCGTAMHTREIAAHGSGCTLHAYEVDQLQLSKNLELTNTNDIEFRFGGAESIAEADGSCDVVMMFKSLHHVPHDALDTAFAEIARVLGAEGHLYISEPVFAGAFNDVIRLFHNEQTVRLAAFEAMQRAVKDGLFDLVEERFFLTPTKFRDFAEFEQRIIQVTHSEHALDEATYSRVQTLFEQHLTPDGAQFLVPMRVDLLRKAH